MSLPALVVLAVLAGGLAGLGDAVVAAAQGWTEGLGGLLVVSTSLGAVLALAVSLPFALLARVAVRPRDDAHGLGWVAAWLLVAPVALAIGKGLYKRLPWSVGDAVP